MPPESAARLAELVRGGGHVIFVERVPEGAAGLSERDERGARVRRELEALWGRPPAAGDVAGAGRGTVAVVADRAAALARLETVLPPDFQIVEPGADRAERPQAGRRERRLRPPPPRRLRLYFVANVSAEHAGRACSLRRRSPRAGTARPRDGRDRSAARLRLRHDGRRPTGPRSSCASIRSSRASWPSGRLARRPC